LFDVLLVGGGGGAGFGETSYNGAGGGGGGAVTSPTNFVTLFLSAATFAVDVGAGGASGAGSGAHGLNGAETKIGSILSVAGGGGGGTSDGQSSKQPQNGGSGGGASRIEAGNQGLSTNPLYGNQGGTGSKLQVVLTRLAVAVAVRHQLAETQSPTRAVRAETGLT
jgi:hypothetical protein